MKDADLMSLADGELDEREARELEDKLARDPIARSKLDAVGELGELVRGHLELSADAVPQRKLDTLWREIDKGIERASAESEHAPATKKGAAAPAGFLRRVGRWFDVHRGHIISGVVGAGAVATLALILRGPSGDNLGNKGSHPIDTTTVSAPAEIESLDTPGGTGTVFNLEDDDGDTTVIWVTPEDTVEGI
ncbi:MAG TPA: hypothetical protein VLB44_17755 [Kofleriaceae bacterium]|nr:hypothetical protein [Kofleriaceae bacterium]